MAKRKSRKSSKPSIKILNYQQRSNIKKRVSIDFEVLEWLLSYVAAVRPGMLHGSWGNRAIKSWVRAQGNDLRGFSYLHLIDAANELEKLAAEDEPGLCVIATYGKAVRNAQLMPRDMSNVDIALQLRAESCEDNDETRAAKRWRETLGKMESIFTTIKETRRAGGDK